MVRIGWLGLAAALLAGGLAAAQETAIAPDAVIARVNGEPITRRALDEQLLRYHGRNGLEELISRSVLDQEAERLQVKVEEKTVEERLAEARRTNGTAFQQALEAEGISEETWRDRARYALLVEQVLAKKWPVKPQHLTKLTIRYARTQNQQQAREIIREARAVRGANFPVLVLQRSLDKENGGVLREILPIDYPAMYQLAIREKLQLNQITPEPIEADGFWLVLRLEGLKRAEQMSAAERKQAEQRIYAYRMRHLIPNSRKRYKIEYPTALTALAGADPKSGPDAVLARVGEEPITARELRAHLLAYYGQKALDQLVGRRIVESEAAKARAAVTDAEINARMAEILKGTGKSAFEQALKQEGITEDAWKERLRYTLLSEKILAARSPVQPAELQRMTVRYIRLRRKEDAEQVLGLARNNAPFEQLAARHSLDRTGDGILKPRAFLRVDNPLVYGAIDEAGIRPGQVLPRVLESGGSWFVLRLEARLGPETMTVQERDSAVRRIQALRMEKMLDDLRKAARVEHVIPIRKLQAAQA